jgi:hypothetical protein
LAKEGPPFKRLEGLLVGERTSKTGLTAEEVLYIFVVADAEVDYYILIQRRGGELIQTTRR